MGQDRDLEAPSRAPIETDEEPTDVRVSDPTPVTPTTPDSVTDDDDESPAVPAASSPDGPTVWDRLQPGSDEDEDAAPDTDMRASDPEPATEVTAEAVDATETEAAPEADADASPASQDDDSADVDASGEDASEGEDDEEEEEDGPSILFQIGEWFVVHTYAGYENKVKANLASRISSMNMEDKIHEVVVPTEEVMELKSGKMQAVQKKVFPGYILVRMDLDDDSWYVVRNTPGVTGFVGSGAKPTPLDTAEVQSILAPKAEERPRLGVQFEAGEVVNVVSGPFGGMTGPIAEINEDQQKVKVLVNIFGRETPVELGFDQVAKL